MLLQTIIFPEGEVRELCFRGSPSMKARETLSFDTYFNSFSYTKYRDYTAADNVVFSCRFEGRARVTLFIFDGEEHEICSVEGNGAAELTVVFSELPHNGFLYPRITALTDVRFIEGRYTSDCSPAGEMSCCIAICTYKREQYVLKNIEQLRRIDSDRIRQVFVIDNGNTLDCDALSGGNVRVIPNRNYGGSGGFTRGLLEAHDGGFTHVMLMDDDISFENEIPERMAAFVSILRPEYSGAHFGTAMLSANVPYMQYELGGADWNGRRVCGGKHDVDVRTPQALLNNLMGNNIGYGAWWCFLMPVSDVPRYGLPFPFFIKLDDVEYGLRTCGAVPIITMNGIAVRHDDFDNKYSMHLEYYNVRNQLVMNAAHNKRPFLNSVYRLFAASFKQLVLYRYDVIPLILWAFNDYLSGVDCFLERDEEQFNLELMRSVPGQTRLSEIPGWDETMRNSVRSCDYKLLSAASLLTGAGHFIPWFLLKNDMGAAPLSRASYKDTLRRKTVIQYQFRGDTGFLTKRSVAKYLACSLRITGMAVKLAVLSPAAIRSYRARKEEITSADFWRNRLGTNQS